MPRKRMIDPSIWDDPDLAQLTRDERLLFIGIFNFADDYGHLAAHPGMLRKWFFGYDDDLSIADVRQMRDHIVATCRNVELYQVDGQDYIWLRTWERHQDLRFRAKAQYPCHRCGAYHTAADYRDCGTPAPEPAPPSDSPADGLAHYHASPCADMREDCGPDQAKLSQAKSSKAKTSQEGSSKAAATRARAPAAPAEAAAAPPAQDPLQQRIPAGVRMAAIVREFELLAGRPCDTARSEIDELVQDTELQVEWIQHARQVVLDRIKAGQRIRQPWHYMLAMLPDYREHGGPPPQPAPRASPGGNGHGPTKPTAKEARDAALERFKARGATHDTG